MISAGYPIDVISVTTAQAKDVDHYGAGKDRCHTFLASPVEYTVPSALLPTEHQAETLSDAEHRIEVRNTFDEPMTIGQKLTIMLDADGIGVILVWKCD